MDQRETVALAVKDAIAHYKINVADPEKTFAEINTSEDDMITILNHISRWLAMPPNAYKLPVTVALADQCLGVQIGAFVDAVNDVTVPVA